MIGRNEHVCRYVVSAVVMAWGTVHASEIPDPRTRTYVEPVRVAWVGGATDNPEALMGAKNGQVPESGWGDGRCCVLKVGDSIALDFGRELHGGLQLLVSRSSGKGVRARVRFGESLSECFSDASSGEKGAGNDHAIRDSIHLMPWMGSVEIGNTGFRFVRIDAVDGTLALESVRAISLMRPMCRLGSFRSSDERLNRIFETAVRTVHLCCQDYLWDGIKRDRLVWVGDMYPETKVILCVFGASGILPKSLDYMADTTRPSEWMNTMPSYTLWWIRNLAAWYSFTGDMAYLRRRADYLRETLSHIEKCISPSNTLDVAGFLDWPTQHNGSAVRSGMQALSVLSFDDAAALLSALGEKELSGIWHERAVRFRSVACDPNGAKSSAALLALSGVRLPKEMYVETLGRDGCDGVSTFYGYFVLEAMSAAGEDQRALDTVRDYWGAMLDVGATSFWENFDLAWTNGCCRIDELPVTGRKDVHGDYGEFCYKGFRHSLCHGWSAGPAAWLINHVLGIRPLESGCRAVEIRPFLGDLEWAEGSMALPDGGAVKVYVRKDSNGGVRTMVSAPDGIRIVR